MAKEDAAPEQSSSAPLQSRKRRAASKLEAIEGVILQLELRMQTLSDKLLTVGNGLLELEASSTTPQGERQPVDAQAATARKWVQQSVDATSSELLAALREVQEATQAARKEWLDAVLSQMRESGAERASEPPSASSNSCWPSATMP